MCPKTGIPLDVLGRPGLTKKFLDQLNNQDDVTDKKRGDCIETQSIISTLSTISIRPKDETPEQRKERKQLVKEYRKVIITFRISKYRKKKSLIWLIKFV